MTNFSAIIIKLGINPCVNVPKNIIEPLLVKAQKDKGPIPVKGTINGKFYTQTVVKYQGDWRLYINGLMIKNTNVKVGDRIDIQIEFDPSSREEKVPSQLSEVFEKNKEAKKAFEKLAPYRKKEILRYLNSMKTEESLNRNIEKITNHLMGKKIEGLHALLRIQD